MVGESNWHKVEYYNSYSTGEMIQSAYLCLSKYKGHNAVCFTIFTGNMSDVLSHGIHIFNGAY